MYNLLGELFSQAGEDEVAEIAYLLEAFGAAVCGREHRDGRAYGWPPVAVATKESEQKVSKLYKELGDLGLVAQRLTPKNRRGKLTVCEVYSSLLEIARTSGREARRRKSGGWRSSSALCRRSRRSTLRVS